MSIIRAFFAIPIPPEDQRRLISICEPAWSQLGDAIRPISPEYWHITLRFLEKIDGESLARIAKTARRAARETPVFKTLISKIASFPAYRAKTIAAHIQSPNVLHHIVKLLDDAVATTGLPKDNRHFRPHITLAKFRSTPLAFTPINLQDMEITVHEIVLFESKPEQNGKHYIPLQRFPLQTN